MKNETPRFSFRLKPALRIKLDKASDGRYAPTRTAIIERGIELALKELKFKTIKFCGAAQQ